MGHERVGVLPRSHRWRAVVAELTAAAASDAVTERVAAATLENVKHRFSRIHEDAGVQAAFGYVLGLTTSHLPGEGTSLVPRIDLSKDPTAVGLGQELARWVDGHADSREYAVLATRAAADAIVYWTKANSSQCELFAPDSKAANLWRRASSGGFFSDITRVFFAKFTERYLKYFLDREASAEIPSLREREVFAARLEHQADNISSHAFETTKIAQSFAAGWFNKNARATRPTGDAIIAFLGFAFGKLRAELEREKAE